MEELVSRKAVIDAILKKAHKIIADLPSAQPEPQWIPVSKRLPEDSYETDLIVTTGSGMVKLACFTKEDGFVSLTGFHRISEVTAWMELELPKPYERKEDDKID